MRQKPEVFRWLEADGERFPVMETPADKVPSRGSVLVLADAGQSPAGALSGALHPVLSAMGWHVMSLGLPALPLPERLEHARRASSEGKLSGTDPSPLPGRDSSITIDLAAPEASDDEAERFDARARARVAAAMTALQARPPGPRVLVGLGLGAGPLTRYMAASVAPGSNVALVWVAPRFEAPGAGSGSPAAWLGDELPWPILDVVDRRFQQSQARDRRLALARIQGNALYRQDALMLFRNASDEGDRLGRRLHSWAMRQFEEWVGD